MAKKNYNFWTFVQDATAAVLAVPTYGASLLISPTARNLITSGGEDKDDNINNALKEWEIKNQQWETQIKANREELERLRKEREKKEEKFKQNNDEIDRLRTITNNPNSTKEEKNNARKRIVLLEDENKKLKEERNKLEKDIEEKSKNPTPPAPTKPFNLPKLSTTDKVIIAGSLTLLIYFVFIKEDKNK